MTNGEKYKSAKERTAAFARFCKGCVKCPLWQSEELACRFAWLDLEAPMSASEVADILEEYNKWRNGKGSMQTNEDLDKAFDRAIEILRNIKE